MGYLKGFDELMKLIREKIETEHGQERTFWNILTALRGPDMDPMIPLLKAHTTQRVRDFVYFLDPQTKESPLFLNATKLSPIYSTDEALKAVNSHFVTHLLSARDAILRLDPTFRMFTDDPPINGVSK